MHFTFVSMTYILIGLLAFLTFRFIVGFLLPVYKATTAAKKQFDQMRSQMHDNFEDNSPSKPTNMGTEKPKFDIGGEYISYEEVKD